MLEIFLVIYSVFGLFLDVHIMITGVSEFARNGAAYKLLGAYLVHCLIVATIRLVNSMDYYKGLIGSLDIFKALRR